MFITLEGIEGAGKSTQALRLADHLRAAGYATRFTREPGGTPLAGTMRALLLHPDESLEALASAGLVAADEPVEPMLPITEVLLLSAARAQHVARIREWLAAGEIVVCDRFADATRAYQGAGRGLDAADIEAATRLATRGLRPDLTLLFELSPAEGLARKSQVLKHDSVQLSLFDPPAWNRLDRETQAFYQAVHDAYLKLAHAEPERFVILDARLPKDELAERVWEAVRDRLPSAAAPPGADHS
jgi:dTMP kinase